MEKKIRTAPYAQFGQQLTKFREEAGLTHQSDLAALLRTTQQTVSRWELGSSRPRQRDIAPLAKVLGVDAAPLAIAAGYQGQQTANQSHDMPLPLDGLNPETFERFSQFFLDALYPGASVHRAGRSGHKQDGLDVDVTFDDGAIYSFQCKRVQEFGAAKVRAAIKAYTKKAAKKFILLSRVASPKARDEIRKHKSWFLWDKEDISLKLRQLPMVEQRRLVDTFFPRQRLTLLGETEAGVWQTTEEFFAPFSPELGAFTHEWALVGRTTEIEQLGDLLVRPDLRAVFLVAPGGGGKSRLLKHAVENFAKAHPATLIRFLSPTEEITNKSLEDLGTGNKLLVVDDAHERTDIKLLMQYAASERNRARTLLALRPYGLEVVKSQAAAFSLAGERAAELLVNPLSLEAATELATQVLTKQSGPVHLAKDIAKLTLDCPLATVMGAWVVSKEKKIFEIAKNEATFRSMLMGKFRDVIAGEISPKNAESIRRVMRVLALVQPFNTDDGMVADICAAVERLPKPETNKILRTLVESGVLFRRGGKYRLSPDMLADYIIESECIGVAGVSTGYAEQVFDAANETLFEHIVVNLGKLDWRLANGDTTNSKLLDGMWLKLAPQREYGDPHLRAVKAVAYYQPGRALEFAERQMRDGTHVQDLPEIIKNASFNMRHLLRACELLWELGRNDKRETGQHPNHAMRILSSLTAVERNKPIEFNEIVVDFALSLLDDADNWNGAFTPLSVLSGIAHTEGHSTSSSGRAISFSPFQVRQAFVAPLRKKIIEKVLALLAHANTRIAMSAATFLGEMLRYPIGLFGAKIDDDTRSQWTPEFVETIHSIRDLMRYGQLDDLVRIELARTVSWHAGYAVGPTSQAAREVTSSLPDSLEFRTLRTLVDPHGRILDRPRKTPREDWHAQVRERSAELLEAYPDGKVLRAMLATQLVKIERAGNKGDGFSLYWELLSKAPSLGYATIADAIEHPNSTTRRFVTAAVATLLAANSSGVADVVRKLLDEGSEEFECAVGRAYSSFDFSNDEDGKHLRIVRELLQSPNEPLIIATLGAIRRLAQHDKVTASHLFLALDLGRSEELAEQGFELLHDEEILPFATLSAADIEVLLGRLALLPKLDGYWIQTFLAKVSKEHAALGAAFFMRRVEHAANTKDWGFRASNHEPYQQVPLQFRESPEFTQVLRSVSGWIVTRPDAHFRHAASELFESMFHPFDKLIVEHFGAWLETAGKGDIEVMSLLLREADEDFIFRESTFVATLLRRAKQFGKKTYETATHSLYAAATTGMRSGTPGEPFPRDLEAKQKAEALLRNLSRTSAEYQLYDLIKQHSEREITDAIREGELYEEDL